MQKCDVPMLIPWCRIHRGTVLVSVLLYLLLSGPIPDSQGQWRQTLLDDKLEHTWGATIADIDGDQDLDVIGYAPGNGDRIVWYENPTWRRHIVARNTSTSDVVVADLDGDGDNDIIAGGGGPNPVFYYENDGGRVPAWTKHNIRAGSDGMARIAVADMDGDSDLDVAAVLFGSRTIEWFENRNGWKKHTVAKRDGLPNAIAIGDLNGDTLPDVAVATWKGADIIWFAAPDWTATVAHDGEGFAYDLLLTDIEGDGDIDIVASAPHTLLLKNSGASVPEWESIRIDAERDSAGHVVVADMDNDGTADILAGHWYDSDIRWYKPENDGWKIHTIADDLPEPDGLAAADLTGDGLPEVVATAFRIHDVMLYWNHGGDVIRVPQHQPTIQAGIDAALERDVVLVDRGRYYENIDFKGKAITVASEAWRLGSSFYRRATVIDGSRPSDPDKGSVVSFISGEDSNSVLTGFTITGGTGTIYEWMSPTPYDGQERTGGGIRIFESGAKIEDNRIIGNRIEVTGDIVASGAGISAYAGFLRGSIGNEIVIRSNEINDNALSAETWSIGAGISAANKKMLLLEKNRILRNVAKSPASARGGGMYIEGYYDLPGPYRIRDNIFQENRADGLKGRGGGIFVLDGILEFANNMILDNSSENRGGGLMIESSSRSSSWRDPVIVNNTITGNSARYYGGGIMVEGSSLQPKVLNTILWGNTAPFGDQVGKSDGGALDIRYSDIQGGWEGASNINEDPLFISGGLAIESRCLNAGVDVHDFGNGVVLQCPPLDINGVTRPSPAGTRPDMGALEINQSTGTAVADAQTIPTSYVLEQNYPNPFNPSTTIAFGLPIPGYVELAVYDIAGRQVAKFVSESMPAGHHEINWEAGKLASGVYVYELTAGTFRESRKMLLLR